MTKIRLGDPSAYECQRSSGRAQHIRRQFLAAIRWTPRHAPPARLTLIVTSVILVATLLGPPISGASEGYFYWYGENGNTCWSSNGAVEAEAPKECDDVGEWFLNSSNPVRTLQGGYNGDIGEIPQSGDYCNAYSNDSSESGVFPLYTRDGNNESGLTGFNPEPPDTMSNSASWILCQAAGARWGQGLRPPSSIKECVAPYQPCGVHHTVSFVSQQRKIRPWSPAFASPILIVEGGAYPGRVNVPGGGWAYLCPILEDTSSETGALLEYCFVEWEKPGYENYIGKVNTTGNPAIVGRSPNTHTSCQVFTDFNLGTAFSTEKAGSGNTYKIGESPWIGPFKAGITTGNLLEAIKSARQAPCSQGNKLSENVANYALIGVEQGIEGAHMTEFGARSEGLMLSTQYFGLNVAPHVATQPTSEVKPTAAEVHGSVNPEGSSTEAYFEYSTEASFVHGVKTPSPGWQIGEGTTYIPTYIKLEGLMPNTTYYDRAVGHNAAGTTEGEAVQFHTPAAQPAVETKSATTVTQTGATLNGVVNPGGAESKYYFEYGPTESYGSRTPEATVASGTAGVEVSKSITGLAANTTYHFRLVATNSSGTGYGGDKSFQTQASGFPATESLDTFERAAENPLSDGGKWSKLGWAKAIGRVFSSTFGWTPSEGEAGAPESEASGAYWNSREFTNPAVSVHLYAENLKDYAALWCDAAGSSSSRSGYRLKVLGTGTSYTFKLLLEKWVSGTKGTLLAEHEVAFKGASSENVIGLTAINGKVQAWYGTSESSLTIEAEASDSTFTKGYVGIEGTNKTAYGETKYRAS